MNQSIHNVAALERLLADADHVDVKTFEGAHTMREFVAGLFNYSPWWLKGLYGVRWGFVRLLGMKQEGVPQAMRISAESVPMQPGQSVTFFNVEDAKDDHYYIASAKEKHLDAYLAVVMEPLTPTRNRFHLITVVHYRHWTGPVYFNVIRPFHHVVVRAMGNAAVRVAPQVATA